MNTPAADIIHRTPTGYLRIHAPRYPGRPPAPSANFDFSVPTLWEGGGEFIPEGHPPLGAFSIQSVFPSFVGWAVATKVSCEVGRRPRVWFDVVGPVFGDPANQ